MNTDFITIETHSSIRVDAERKDGGRTVIYFDPYEVKNETHDADIIFFTHSHYDHFSPEDFAKVAREDTIYIAPLSMKKDFQDAGIPGPKAAAVLGTAGDKADPAGIRFEMVPAYNENKDFHPEKNGWLGYVITTYNGGEKTRIYVTGDMDAVEKNTEIDADILLLPVGGTFTMDYREAAEFAAKLGPEVAIPTHYGTVAGEPEDGQKFRDELAKLAPEIQVDIKL